MRFLGGKSRIAKNVTAAILQTTNRRSVVYEPFMGGCAMTTVLAPHFVRAEASDIDENVVILWRAIKDGWRPPTTVTETEYRALRHAPPSALRSFVGFGCSFGGKWFGGYARYGTKNYAAMSARSVEKTGRTLQHTDILLRSYTEFLPSCDSVVYCDPPYTGRTGYNTKWNTALFYSTMEYWAKNGAHVFVSEYTGPENWPVVWQREIKQALRGDLKHGKNATEKLYFLG